MHRRLLTTLAATALAGGALAACSSGGSTGSSSGAPSAAASSGSAASGSAASGSASSGSAALATASTSLGTVVVDGRGMTAYFYDKDTPGSGTSTCTGTCATLWPAIDADSAHPVVHGVTGTVGTVTAPDGDRQVTLDGRPLYTYAGDAKPGDVTGQGIGGIWHVVSPDGKELTGAGTGTSTSSGGVTY